MNKFIIVFCILTNSLWAQNKDYQMIEDSIVSNIDTFLADNNISKDELIHEFEKILINNDFTTETNIAKGYSMFYDYQKNPFIYNLNIKPIDLNEFPNLINFRRCYIKLLPVFLNVNSLTEELNGLDESSYVIKILNFLKYLETSGNSHPISFEISNLKVHNKLSEFSKLSLILIFNGYINFNFLIMGEKLFSPAFVDSMPKAPVSNSFHNGEIWLKVKKHTKTYEKRSKLISKSGELTKIKTRDYLRIFFVINERGNVQKICTTDYRENRLYKIANKFIKQQYSNWQPAVYKGKSVKCASWINFNFYE